jgi:hypothetical protein
MNKISAKTVIVALIIEALILTSALYLGGLIGNKYAEAIPAGITDSPLDISKGGTAGDTKESARENLDVYSTTETDDKLLNRVYDVGTFTTFAYATIYPLFAANNATVLTGIASSAAGTAQRPIDTVTNVTIEKSDTNLNITAIDSNGIVYTANYSTGNPVWKTRPASPAQGEISYTSSGSSFDKDANVFSSATKTFTVPSGTTNEDIIISKLSYGNAGYQEYLGNIQYNLSVSGTTATLVIWARAQKGFAKSITLNLHWVAFPRPASVYSSWTAWQDVPSKNLTGTQSIKVRTFVGDPNRVQLRVEGNPASAIARGDELEVSDSLPSQYRPTLPFVSGTANISGKGPVASIKVSDDGKISVSAVALALATTNLFDSAVIEYRID